MAVQIVCSSRRGSRDIEHIGSARDEAELEVLKAYHRTLIRAGVCAMTTARLPGDGEVRLGPVRLPPGRRIISEDGEPVAWVTDDVVPGPGQAWSALRDLHADTGLAPVLLDPRDNLADFFFTGGVDPGEIDGVSAVQVLADMWPEYGDDAGAPPGKESDLAPVEDVRLPAATLTAALDSFQAAHIGLVSAARPADVPAAVGWVAFDDLSEHRNAVWLGSVLRSFEDRFGAVLLMIGSGARIRLLVERPPRTLEAARKVAAEHKAIADEHADLGSLTVSLLAPVLVDAPVWSFWWD
jgi:hypothetical protein